MKDRKGMISIIIPTYKEEEQIAKTICTLKEYGSDELITEIIVADGQSPDQTAFLAAQAGARVVVSPTKGRAAQMNYGAALAKGSILYFIHADTVPPPGYARLIREAVEMGASSGCFRLKFDHPHWFLRANAWFTRFDVDAFRFGDQSLFVTAEAFLKAGRFNEKLIVMEDQEIVQRLRKVGNFRVLPKPVVTSARKYLENGIYKTQGIFFLIYFLYCFGFSQEKLVRIYRKLIRQDKV